MNRESIQCWILGLSITIYLYSLINYLKVLKNNRKLEEIKAILTEIRRKDNA